ncbi:EF hand domain containing protein [Anopheles sinensis]|uniref:EF hand domain containing protein n=1 Tax=Anopheles sinensis TaxID=74873 RepID=A0A084VXU7_ANOSI|nr:EF hand domain containing protein [Anopheles sinensis]
MMFLLKQSLVEPTDLTDNKRIGRAGTRPLPPLALLHYIIPKKNKRLTPDVDILRAIELRAQHSKRSRVGKGAQRCVRVQFSPVSWRENKFSLYIIALDTCQNVLRRLSTFTSRTLGVRDEWREMARKEEGLTEKGKTFSVGSLQNVEAFHASAFRKGGQNQSSRLRKRYVKLEKWSSLPSPSARMRPFLGPGQKIVANVCQQQTTTTAENKPKPVG